MNNWPKGLNNWPKGLNNRGVKSGQHVKVFIGNILPGLWGGRLSLFWLLLLRFAMILANCSQVVAVVVVRVNPCILANKSNGVHKGYQLGNLVHG